MGWFRIRIMCSKWLHAGLTSKNKDGLAQNQNNVFKWLYAGLTSKNKDGLVQNQNNVFKWLYA
jgi:hypothetical protein